MLVVGASVVSGSPTLTARRACGASAGRGENHTSAARLSLPRSLGCVVRPALIRVSGEVCRSVGGESLRTRRRPPPVWFSTWPTFAPVDHQGFGGQAVARWPHCAAGPTCRQRTTRLPYRVPPPSTR